jgi:3-oxoacyl-[acyl-carrier protein] reductase
VLSDRVALVTGAARGIGFSIARKFAEHGCHIVLNTHRDLSEYEGGTERVESIVDLGVECRVVKADVTSGQEVADLVNGTITEFGKLDILVNNAAFAPHPKSLFDIPEEEWDRTLAVNLKGAFLLCREAGRHMVAAKYGKIINISATSGKSPVVNLAHYNSAKAALHMLTQEVALELAPFNVAVNCICPGIIQTELVESVIPPGVSKERFFKKFGEMNIPMARVGQPEEIANAALFLASEMSSYITGDILMVSGGSPLFRTTLPQPDNQ